MKRQVRLIAIFCSCTIFNSAASAVTPVNDYLREAVQAVPGASVKQKIGMGGGHRVFEEVQFRWLREQDKDAQELRVKAKMPGQIAAEYAMLSVHAQLQQTQQDKLLNDELLERYQVWLNVLTAEQYWMLSLQRLNLAEAELDYEKQLASTADFNPKALLKAELAVDSQRINSQRRANDMAHLRELVSLKSAPVSISLKEMLQWFEGNEFTVHSWATMQAQLEQRLAEQSVRREKSRHGLALNLIAAQRESNTVQNDMRYTVGLQLPLGGRSFNEAKQQVVLAEAQAELQRQRRLAVQQRGRRIAQIERLQAQLQEVQALQRGIEQKLNTAMVAKRPSLALLLKQEQLDYAGRKLELQRQAHDLWLQLLHSNGQLAQRPLRNWLLSAQPVL